MKVGDFGLSRMLDEERLRGQSAAAVSASLSWGPIAWMAPEQLEHRLYSHKSDVFMFGVCMFEMVRLSYSL